MDKDALAIALVASSCVFAASTRPAAAQDTTEPETPPSPTPPQTPIEPTQVQPPPLGPLGPAPEGAAAPVEPAPAREEKEKEPRHPRRTVGGHEFIFPTRVDSAIVATYIGVRARIVFESAEDLPTEAGPFDLEGITLAESLDFGLAFTKFLGVFASVGGRSLVGTNVPGLLFRGVTYDFGGVGGAILRLFESETTGTQLSLRGGFGYLDGQIASPLPIFQIESARVAIREVLLGNLRQAIYSPIETMQYGGTLALAQGFGSFFGVQLSAGVGGGSFKVEPYDINAGVRNSFRTTGVTYDFGIAPSVDFRKLGPPIALQAEVVLSRSPTPPVIEGEQRGFDTTGYTLLGAYYSGRPNLQLGLVGGFRLGIDPVVSRLGSSATPSQVSGELVLRYIW